MIYFLDNSLQLQKIVTSKNVISAIHEHELNGLIRADVELDLAYANKFLILGIDHVGYYYKDEFYLHKIQRVEYDHVSETATVVLRHIFFEDMIFGKLIQDVRPQNQDALTISRQTIDANTRWQTIMTDVTGRLSTNFYWQVPYEVIEFMTENYRIEYLPKILFDGKKINGFQLHLANKIGEDKNIRIPYGSRVLDLKYEEDYSEIITKLVVHGKGEEVGDGYGRRINISDVNFSRNGVESPVGSLYLEDESITNTYGNDGQTPREGREVFEDIEDANELAEAGYQHYLQVSRPQMLFTADVADIGDVSIGDSVMIIRREYDVYFNARIHKLSVDLLYPEDAQVELGDYEHFKESKVERKTREKNNRVQGQLSDRITQLKLEANERFDNEVAQWKSEFEQALIDAHAQIEADRENMTNLIEGTRTEFTDNLDAEITQTKEYAEQQAQAKAGAVGDKLDAFSERHEALVGDIGSDVSELKISNSNIQAAVSDGNGLASTIALSPTAIDLISDKINVTGNVNISGGVTALAVDAIEGNFSRLFASSLTSNVIKSDHIQTDTALAKKLFATNANIDELVTRTHFSNSIKTLSIDAVHADLSSVNSEIMTTNILKSDWIDVDNAIVNRIISRQFFTENAEIKAANIRDLTATDIRGGVLSSINNSMRFDLMDNHLEFSSNATIDFLSTNNQFRMIYPSSTQDSRDVIVGFGTTRSSSGVNMAYFGGGHYDIDGSVQANGTGFAGLRVGGGSNDSRLTGTNVEVGHGNDSDDMYFRFDFESSRTSRFARFRPPTSSDNYVLGGDNTPFHSVYTWRLNRLRFTNLSGNTEMRYDDGGTNGAGFRFTKTDVYFLRGGLWSLKEVADKSLDAYNSINASNGLREQIRSLALRVSKLE